MRAEPGGAEEGPLWGAAALAPPTWNQRARGVQPQPQVPPRRQGQAVSQRHPHPQRWAPSAAHPQVSAGLLGVLQVMGVLLGLG